MPADKAPPSAARPLPAGLDETRLAAWRGLLNAHAAVVAAIERDLAAAEGAYLPLTWYDVLLALVESPEHRLRLHELARRVVLSRSGLTRLVDRLEVAGLLRREPDSTDRRGAFAVLTEAGRDALRRTWPAYAAGIMEHFARHLSEAEARVIATALERVRSGEARSE
jgi:DNA-binding MarR family transcriptional regulator